MNNTWRTGKNTGKNTVKNTGWTGKNTGWTEIIQDGQRIVQGRKQ